MSADTHPGDERRVSYSPVHLGRRKEDKLLASVADVVDAAMTAQSEDMTAMAYLRAESGQTVAVATRVAEKETLVTFQVGNLRGTNLRYGHVSEQPSIGGRFGEQGTYVTLTPYGNRRNYTNTLSVLANEVGAKLPDRPQMQPKTGAKKG